MKAPGTPFEVGDMIASVPALLGGGYLGVLRSDAPERGSRVYATTAVVMQVVERPDREPTYVVLAALDEGTVLGNVGEAHKVGSGWQSIENFACSEWGRL